MDEHRAHGYAWLVSNITSILVFIGVLIIWYWVQHSYKPYPGQLTTTAEVQQFLYKNWESKHPNLKTIYISTGMLIHTLTFRSPNELLITGYLWQHVPKNIHINLKRQIYLLDQVMLNKQPLNFEHLLPNEVLVQTSFESLIQQGLNYNKYPFDDKIVQLIIFPVELDVYQNIVMVPDLAAYKDVSRGSIMGIDPEVIINGFKVQESYFMYNLTNYDTNFGLPNTIKQRGFPDLTFVIALKRAIFSAVVVHVLPLVIVIILLFAILMMNSERKDKFIKFNFTGTMSVASCSALFFVLVLVHAGIRAQIYSNQIVYLEYFYFLAYILIAIVVLNNYILLNDSKKKVKFIHYGDNLLPKVLFWPSIMVFTLIVSIKVLL
jgi:hypothetical protein